MAVKGQREQEEKSKDPMETKGVRHIPTPPPTAPIKPRAQGMNRYIKKHTTDTKNSCLQKSENTNENISVDELLPLQKKTHRAEENSSTTFQIEFKTLKQAFWMWEKIKKEKEKKKEKRKNSEAEMQKLRTEMSKQSIKRRKEETKS